MDEQKKILKTQIELLNIKQARINQIRQQFKEALKDLSRVKRQAIIEIGIPEEEADQWEISLDGRYFIKTKGEKKNEDS